jgi:hypothetical protein
MSVSIQSVFTPNELALEVEWLKVRDTLVGENYVKRDVKRALELAAASEHPQCQWLTDLFVRKTVSTVKEAQDVFLADEKNSPVPASLCFAALLSSPVDVVLLCKSADMGHPLAQAKMAGRTNGEEKFQFAKSAASQREREGFFWLGFCHQFGKGCEPDLEMAKKLHLIAVQLGSVLSMCCLGRMFDESDPRWWFWLGRAVVLGFPDASFLGNFSARVQSFNSGSGNDAVVFQIGKALNGHVNVEERTIFGGHNLDIRISSANSAISFYKAQLVSCRLAVDTWSHIGIRCNVVKDIRVLIGKLVWETRDLAFYKV